MRPTLKYIHLNGLQWEFNKIIIHINTKTFTYRKKRSRPFFLRLLESQHFKSIYGNIYSDDALPEILLATPAVSQISSTVIGQMWADVFTVLLYGKRLWERRVW